MKMIRIIVLIWLCMGGVTVYGQNRLLVDTGKYDLPRFIPREDNVLQGNTEGLKPFLMKLFQLRKLGDAMEQKVRIVHIGDSHLQAGYLNGTVMRHFHADFGNAGRGLVVPLKLSATNEPIDYDIVSDIHWNSARCLSQRPRYPVGIGGISIVPKDTLFHLEVQIPRSEAERYRFNRVEVYHLPGAVRLVPCDSGVRRIEEPYPFLTSYELASPVSRFRFKGYCSVPDSCVYYGFCLENGQNGVLYHTIGINGAQYSHYRNVDRFTEQVCSLKPDLVIFSLGTNEAFRGTFNEAVLRREMDAVVLEVKRANPEAVMILTTPAECQWKVKRRNVRVFEPNPWIGPIAGLIIKYAREHELVYWDLFQLAGGSGSSENWIAANFLARDRIHFGVAGYRLQGNLLYEALMREYNRYVRKIGEQRLKEEWKDLLFPEWGKVKNKK